MQHDQVLWLDITSHEIPIICQFYSILFGIGEICQHAEALIQFSAREYNKVPATQRKAVRSFWLRYIEVTGTLPPEIQEMTREMLGCFDELYASEKGVISQIVLRQFTGQVAGDDAIDADSWIEHAREKLAIFLAEAGEEELAEELSLKQMDSDSEDFGP